MNKDGYVTTISSLTDYVSTKPKTKTTDKTKINDRNNLTSKEIH